MTLIRACFLFLAVTLPTTWTIARAADEPAGGEAAGGEKKASKKKSKKKDKGAESGGDMKKE